MSAVWMPTCVQHRWRLIFSGTGLIGSGRCEFDLSTRRPLSSLFSLSSLSYHALRSLVFLFSSASLTSFPLVVFLNETTSGQLPWYRKHRCWFEFRWKWPWEITSSADRTSHAKTIICFQILPKLSNVCNMHALFFIWKLWPGSLVRVCEWHFSSGVTKTRVNIGVKPVRSDTFVLIFNCGSWVAASRIMHAIKLSSIGVKRTQKIETATDVIMLLLS